MSSGRPSCKFFATKSGCKLGANCPYLHSESPSISLIPPERDKDHGTVRKTQESEQEGSVNKEAPQSVKDPSRDDSNSKKICTFFAKTRRCRFGEQCRFSHVLKPDQRRDQGKTKGPGLGPVQAVETSDQDGRRRGKGEHEKAEGVVRDENLPILESSNSSHKDTESSKPEDTEVGTGKVCTFFAKTRRCRYGAQCRFSHAVSSGHQQKPRKTNAAQNEPANKEKERKTPADTNEDRPDQGVKYQDDGGVKSSRNVGDIEQHQPKPKQRPRKLCRYFKDGGCSMGQRCRFRHPADLLKDPLDGSGPTSEGPELNPAFISTHTSGRDEEAKRPNPAQRQPVVVRNPPTLKVLEGLSEDDLVKLRQTEIDQLKKRFPKGKVSVIEGDPERYLVEFSPTDPDWPYDVKSLQLVVYFPYKYPVRRMIVKVSEEQNLPPILARHIWRCMREWMKDRHAMLLQGGQVELAFRQFLRWLDRNAEEMFTEGLRKVQRELIAKQAGLEFIPASKLRGTVETDSSEGEEEEAEVDEEDDEHGDTPEDEECVRSEEEEEYDSEEEIDEEELERKLSLDPVRRGTEVRLKNLQLTQNSATLLTDKLNIVIQCVRCKNRCDVKTPGERVNVVACAKCHSEQYLTFHPAMAHQFSSVLGYLDVQGCMAFDLILPECDFSLGCLNCSNQMAVGGIQPGQLKETWCKSCHAKMAIGADNVKFHHLLAGNEIDTNSVHVVNIKKPVRSVKDPSIREGFPLPDNGICKHYKKSFRWLRFPCCGKAYPCDICHDDKEDHEMKIANRMICGHCSKEQFYSADKPCKACNAAMTKFYSADKPCKACDAAMTKVRTRHWEGGKGCRDRTAMNRNDDKKYSNGNKTISRKAAAKTQPKKKVTKLRHS